MAIVNQKMLTVFLAFIDINTIGSHCKVEGKRSVLELSVGRKSPCCLLEERGVMEAGA